MCTTLFTQLVSDQLNELAYEAELAGFRWSLGTAAMSAAPGINLTVSGFTAKLPKLLDEIVALLAAFPIRRERFDVMKEKLAQNYRNWSQQPPYAWGTLLAELAMQTGARVA